MTRQSELPKHYLVGLNITHDCVWKIQVEIVYSVEGTPSVSMSIICCVRVHHLCDVDILVLTVTNRPLLTIPPPPPPPSLSCLTELPLQLPRSLVIFLTWHPVLAGDPSTALDINYYQ